MHPVAKARHTLGQQFVEESTVSRDEEHILACITAQDHVIKTTRQMQSGFAGHGRMLMEQRDVMQYAKPDPYVYGRPYRYAMGKPRIHTISAIPKVNQTG